MAALIVVFDTNTLLPLTTSQSTRAMRLRRAWFEGRVKLAITPQVVAEFQQVIHRHDVLSKLALTVEDADRAVANLQRLSLNLPGHVYGITAVKEDPSDNIFLACAIEAGADFLVSQDPHLLNLKYYLGTQIVSLAQFAQLMTAKET